MNSSWGSSAEVVMAVVVVIGLIVGAIRFFYHRGERENAVVTALNRNTEAAGENTKANKELSAELKDFKAETMVTLRDYGWRLTILEDKTKAYEDNNAS